MYKSQKALRNWENFNIAGSGAFLYLAASYDEEAWKEAFIAVRNQFEIDTLFPEQELAIKTFVERDNVFINLPTGYGKSLIYQCIPLVVDILNGNPRGTSVLVVISPLKALMEDQVEYLGNVGISAIAVEDKTDPEFLQMIKNGVFMVVYCSPECALSTTTWKEIFNDSCFREKLVGVAVDEAHCIRSGTYYFHAFLSHLIPYI